MVGKNLRRFKSSVTIVVFKSSNATVPRLCLQSLIQIEPRRLCHVKPSVIIEAGKHREDDLRFTGDLFDHKTVRCMNLPIKFAASCCCCLQGGCNAE